MHPPRRFRVDAETHKRIFKLVVLAVRRMQEEIYM